MGETLRRMQALARLIRHTHQGPLGSETLIDQALLGEFVDTGDLGVMDGHHRLFSPEFKLRRLHHLSTFHGTGLMYRFFEMPPYKQFHSGRTTFGNNAEQLDDYRACEVLFGNGAYVCYSFANWRYHITECLLVGHLQRHYAGQPVRSVSYWHEGEWASLEDLVRMGIVPNIDPWNGEPTSAYGRVRVEYENGLTVVVNRLRRRFDMPDADAEGLTLPQSGWVAWKADGSLLAFSGHWPGTRHRVDYLRDRAAKIEYIDPRGAEIRGVSSITLWEAGRPAITADPDSNELRVRGKAIPLDLPPAPPISTLEFEFEDSLERWRPAHGILAAQLEAGTLQLTTISSDPQLHSPPLRIPGSDVPVIEVRMRASAGEVGQLYFRAEGLTDVAAEDMVVRFKVTPDGEFHTYRLPVGEHPRWRGQTITGIRFDPIHGPTKAELAIDYIRGVGE